jgi:hypothetical protein
MLMTNRGLTIIFLHWNKIRWKGGIEIANSLKENDVLQILDLSFNAIGNGYAKPPPPEKKDDSTGGTKDDDEGKEKKEKKEVEIPP